MIDIMLRLSTKQIQPARGWCTTVKRDCENCIHLILPLRRPCSQFFWGSQSCEHSAWLAKRQLLAGDIESITGPKPTLKTLLHTLNTLILQSNPLNPPHPHSPQPTHRLTHPHISNPLSSLCKTHTHTTERASIQLHTLIYLKQHTGPLYVSREGGASASQVERTPGRANLTSWVVGPHHSYTQEGSVDNNMLRLATVRTDIEASILLYSALIGAYALFLISFFFCVVDWIYIYILYSFLDL